ncbi:MAG TPA: hypothetical protein VK864_04915, partial [Longimicrobiales bacterium]|nr:hypothetical protein [Longimicrobiales bacterium]
MTEEWKWMVPVWSHHGIVCTGEAYTKVVKLTFAQSGSQTITRHLRAVMAIRKDRHSGATAVVTATRQT